jgi:hypothetical protein
LNSFVVVFDGENKGFDLILYNNWEFLEIKSTMSLLNMLSNYLEK